MKDNCFTESCWFLPSLNISFSLKTFWRRKWQPTPVFLPEKSHGWRSLESYSPWGRRESDTSERSQRKIEKITFSYFSSKLYESPLIGDERYEELLHISWFKYHWMLWVFPERIKKKKILWQNKWKLKGNKVSLAYLLQKAMAPHSSTLAWKIPWMEEPGRLQSWGRWGSDTTERLHFYFSLSLFTFMHWRRKWQPTPVFLPGESQGWGSLVGCRLWGRKESDMTEAT